MVSIVMTVRLRMTTHDDDVVCVHDATTMEIDISTTAWYMKRRNYDMHRSDCDV